MTPAPAFGTKFTARMSMSEDTQSSAPMTANLSLGMRRSSSVIGDGSRHSVAGTCVGDGWVRAAGRSSARVEAYCSAPVEEDSSENSELTPRSAIYAKHTGT